MHLNNFDNTYNRMLGYLSPERISSQSAQDTAFPTLPDGAIWFRTDIPALVQKVGLSYEIQPVPVFDLMSGRFGTIDTTGTGDNTAPLLRARDAAMYAGRGIIQLPACAGFRLTEGLGEMLGSIIVRGSGMQATKVLWDPSSGHEADIVFGFGDGGGGTTEDERFGCGIEELRVEGDTPSTPTGIAIQFNATIYGICRRVRVKNFQGSGAWALVLKNVAQHTCLDQVELDLNSNGMDVQNANATSCNNLMLNNNVTIGARFTAARTFSWHGGLLQGNTVTMVTVAPSSPNAVDGLALLDLDTEPGDDATTGTDDVFKAVAGTGSIRGLTILGGTWQPGKAASRIFNFDGVNGFVLSPGHVMAGGGASFKARSSKGLVIGSDICNLYNGGSNGIVVDVDSSNTITWHGASGTAFKSQAPTQAYQGAVFGSDSCFAFGTTGGGSIGVPVAGMAYYRSSRKTAEAYINSAWGPLSKRHALRSGLNTTTSGTHTNLVDVTDLAVDLKASAKYAFRFWCPYQSTDTATGIQFAVAYGGTVSALQLSATVIFTPGTAPYSGYATATGTKLGPGAGAGSGPGSTTTHAVIEGTIATTTAGTFKLQMCSNDASKSVTTLAGTNMELAEVDDF